MIKILYVPEGRFLSFQEITGGLKCRTYDFCTSGFCLKYKHDTDLDDLDAAKAFIRNICHSRPGTFFIWREYNQFSDNLIFLPEEFEIIKDD